MNRKDFISQSALLAVLWKIQTINSMQSLLNLPDTQHTMPALFVGHGSPMNAIEQNEFTQKWAQLGQTLPKPAIILCISAHWETYGTQITAMDKPKTIHDFGGFPQALFDVEYPAPGSSTFANQTHTENPSIALDQLWGLDHGCWSILTTMYPKADIPVLQLSLDVNKTPQQHFEMANSLLSLRKKGVLILGSGNMVHNLGRVAWDKMSMPEYGYDWAIQANTEMKSAITNHNLDILTNYSKQGPAWNLAIPTPEHYLPLLYTLGVKSEKDNIQWFNDKAIMGSLTMTSFVLES
jgi:4,5-DOPA dioxygenase extradiol